MKILLARLTAALLNQSCQTSQEQNTGDDLLLDNCDELSIIFYGKDTFVFKTIDTSTIKNFTALISKNNENLIDSCQTTEKLIYSSKGHEIFTAQVSVKNIKDSVDCNYITYYLGSKKYRHRLTYRTGMGMDEIYWHKINPQGNPRPGIEVQSFITKK